MTRTRIRSQHRLQKSPTSQFHVRANAMRLVLHHLKLVEGASEVDVVGDAAMHLVTREVSQHVFLQSRIGAMR